MTETTERMTDNNTNTHIIIVAAGTGNRFGGDIPKQFVELCGRPVLAHTIEAFRQALPEAEITLVLSHGMMPLWRELCMSHGIESPHVVAGGATRWESVRNAVESLAGADPSATVLIHDGARPLVTGRVIQSAAAAARNADGAIPAIPVTDSLRVLDENCAGSTPVDRARFRAVQTPQAFALWRLRRAYALPYEPSFTDDASVLAAAGFHNIALTEGSPENIKLTTPTDLLLARAIIESRDAAHNRS